MQLRRTAGLHQAIVAKGVDLVTGTITTTSLMVGGFRSKALLTLLVEDETFASAFRCGNDQLWFLKQLYL